MAAKKALKSMYVRKRHQKYYKWKNVQTVKAAKMNVVPGDMINESCEKSFSFANKKEIARNEIKL